VAELSSRHELTLRINELERQNDALRRGNLRVQAKLTSDPLEPWRNIAERAIERNLQWIADLNALLAMSDPA
jgi:hypothetical protein